MLALFSKCVEYRSPTFYLHTSPFSSPQEVATIGKVATEVIGLPPTNAGYRNALLQGWYLSSCRLARSPTSSGKASHYLTKSLSFKSWIDSVINPRFKSQSIQSLRLYLYYAPFRDTTVPLQLRLKGAQCCCRQTAAENSPANKALFTPELFRGGGDKTVADERPV